MKFSIITITYNRAHLIGETIESVLNQTYQDFEHIIIDDGSTDNTEKVVNSFKDKRIIYYKYIKHTNRSFLRNEGIRKSNGDIICILDSDDTWHNDKLVNLFEIFNAKKEVVFTIHNVLKSNDSLIYKYKTDFYRNILKDILKNKILPYPFYSFRKSLLKNIKMYDEKMVDGQQDFFLRIASQYSIYFISKVLSFKKTHYNNISKTPRLSALENFNITLKDLLNNHKITTKEFNNLINYNNLKIARFHYFNNDKNKSDDYLNKILIHSPIFTKIYLKTLLFKYSNN